MTLSSPFPSTMLMTMTAMRKGKLMKRSVTRMTISSVIPPAKAPKPPNSTPITSVMETTIRPTRNAFRLPHTIP